MKFFLEQLRKFNKDEEIIFLVNEINLENDLFKKYNISTSPIEDLNSELLIRFISKFGHGDINSNKRDIKYGSSDYWCVTATRLFYLYEYVRKNNINKFFHFENDIMIYENVQNILNIIKDNNLYDDISITRGTENKIMTGFMYVNNPNSLGDLLNGITEYLFNKDLFNYGIDMVNEMSLLHIYQIKNPNKLKHLPILPSGDFSGDLLHFDSVFDPATYGQYLDGIPSNPGVSITTDSYIGDEIRNNGIKIEFIITDGYKIPFLIVDDKKIKINNLHIHSKRLELFLS
jgi:hypothetical protein